MGLDRVLDANSLVLVPSTVGRKKTILHLKGRIN